MRPADTQDGHTIQTPGTAARMAPGHGNSGVCGTSGEPVDHLPHAPRPAV